VENPERQGAEHTGEVHPEFFDIQYLSKNLGIRPKTLYAMVEERSIPHYRIRKLIRFKRCEIERWLEGKRIECVDPKKVARKTLARVQKPKIDIRRLVGKAIERTRGQGYTEPHGKPDQVEGLGKEAEHGTL
jgi:excisionase family DNA binding protein